MPVSFRHVRARRHRDPGCGIAWRAGCDGPALSGVYGKIKRLARKHLRSERDEHTLSPTALVHEAFLKLVDQNTVSWESQAHFYGVATLAMRRILVDHARRRAAARVSTT